MGIEPGKTLSGKFRVIRLLGEGGMGAVYEVEHEFTKHRRALKTLHGEFAANARIVQRFLNEASAAGRIGNPHIIETFDAGELDTGDPYIVMELLDGKPWDEQLRQKPRLDFDEALDIILQACDGIAAAHDSGIIHRDLKPENLFIVAGDRPFVKILDFGISKFDPELTGSSSLTQEGSALGTPFYMPPEQVRGATDVDKRVDVYALGVLLYESLTGSKPFYADTLPHLAVLIHEGKYPPLDQRRPDAPPGLGAVVAKAMAVDRDDRFRTVREFAAALTEVREGKGAGIAGTLALEEMSVGASPTAAHGTPDLNSSGSAPTEAAGTPSDVKSETAASGIEPQHAEFVTAATQVDSATAASLGDSAGQAAVPVGTAAGVETNADAGSKKSSMPVVVGVIVVIGLAAAAAVALRGGPASVEPVSDEPQVAAAPPATEQAGPKVEPTLAAPDPLAPPDPPALSASAAPPDVAKAPSKPPSGSTPTGKKAPPKPAVTGTTRAEKHGLSQDNPF